MPMQFLSLIFEMELGKEGSFLVGSGYWVGLEATVVRF